MSKDTLKLTPQQEALREAWLPKPPDGLSEGERSFFLRAVAKITCKPHENGGLAFSYEGLTEDELFALNITGTGAWPLGEPTEAREILRAMRPTRQLGPYTVTIPITDNPDLAAAEERVREVLRKQELTIGRAKKFLAGRPENKEIVQHVEELAKNNRMATAKGLLAIADKNIIGGMGYEAFREYVTPARKIYPKQKKRTT